MNNYMRMTIGQFSTGNETEGPAGDSVSMDLSGTPVTGNMYYENGMYYMDMMDQKKTDISCSRYSRNQVQRKLRIKRTEENWKKETPKVLA